MSYQILLFYKYVAIADPQLEMQKQRRLCEDLGLKCRIIIAHEGINGTLEGKLTATTKYIQAMQSDSRFADIDWKKSVGTGTAFPKISIKVRPEIVSLNLGEDDFDPNQISGKYITADRLHKLYESGEEFYVIDMRNDYEQQIGHFENAILMPIKNFRELPETLDQISHLKNKKVITTCTGGIRCEKASGFLIKHGFTNVYQLYGGMQTYMEKFPRAHFLGKLYVFDGRVVWGLNTDSIISKCALCGKSSDRYVDCAYKHCQNQRHFIGCEDCAEADGKIYCSPECKMADRQSSEFVQVGNQNQQAAD